MKRNSQIFLKKNKPLIAERKNAHNVKDMIKFYDQYNRCMNLFDCTSHDMWNID
jgi:hypothetical protein